MRNVYKVGISGSYGIGKSRIAGDIMTALRSRLALTLEYITDTARNCPEHIRQDTLRAQMWVMYHQIAKEIEAEHRPLYRDTLRKVIICDTTVLDNYAYALQWASLQQQDNGFKGLTVLRSTLTYWVNTYDTIFLLRSVDGFLNGEQHQIDLILERTVRKYRFVNVREVRIQDHHVNIVAVLLDELTKILG